VGTASTTRREGLRFTAGTSREVCNMVYTSYD
jgi:hypothetical protein